MTVKPTKLKTKYLKNGKVSLFSKSPKGNWKKTGGSPFSTNKSK